MGKPKQFCVNGHDTAIAGRDQWSTCRACTYERKRSEKYLAQQRIYDAGRRGTERRLRSQREHDRGRQLRRGLERFGQSVKAAISRLDPILQALFR